MYIVTSLRVILDGPLPGAVNMTTDARLLAGHRPAASPVLRLYRWSPPAVSIGYNQRDLDFDGEAIRALGYDLVQRPTGGRAILHADELTYAVVGTSPSPLFGATLHETYQIINRALLRFLAMLGVEAEVSAGESREAQRSAVCFRSAGRHEIGVGGRKLIGSAQRRTGQVFLQHGSILTGTGHADLARCLARTDANAPGDQRRTGHDPHTARNASRRELLDATTDLGHLLGRTIDEDGYRMLSDQLVAAFAETLSIEVAAEPSRAAGDGSLRTCL